MLKVRFIASIAERDIDLLVLEEFSVNDEFCDWFSARIYGASVYQNVYGAWHSVTDGSSGESDLIFAFTSQSGQRLALLIENKIDAMPQPEQGERYKTRGRNGIQSGYWDAFKTCLIAPERYLTSSKHTQIYDAEIAYEELFAFFSSRRFRDCRFLYKAKIVQEAIEQNRRGYQPEYNEPMTRFVEKYHAVAIETFPKLGMQDSKPRPSGSTWVMFSPSGLSKSISFCHQLTAGLVKVFFSGELNDVESIQKRYVELIDKNMAVSQTGKSISISAQVPKITPLNNTFEVEYENVTRALETLSRLLSIVRSAEGIDL